RRRPHLLRQRHGPRHPVRRPRRTGVRARQTERHRPRDPDRLAVGERASVTRDARNAVGWAKRSVPTIKRHDSAGARHFAPSPTLRAIIIAALAIVLAGTAHAAAPWPTRAVTIVVPYAAGGMADVMARLAAQRLSQKFGQPFIILNRGGDAGAIGAT